MRLLRDGQYAYEERVLHTLRASADANRMSFHIRNIGGRVQPVIPGEDRWNLEVPAWARGRRSEIVERISEYFDATE